jgi:hypothetical protein
MKPTLVLVGEGNWMNYFLEAGALFMKVNVQLALFEEAKTQESLYAPTFFGTIRCQRKW